MNSINVLKAIELLAHGKYPKSREDRIRYEGVLLRNQITELAETINSTLPPEGSLFLVVEDVPVHVTYTYDPENRLGSRLIRSVAINGVWVKGVDILALVDDALALHMANMVEERINK